MYELKNTTIQKIFIDDNFIKFETDKGSFVYRAQNDCCNDVYLHDFIGVKNLLGRKIKAIEAIENKNVEHNESQDNMYIDSYGYRLVVEHPEYGEVSAVLSCRNEHNGYYGGFFILSQDHPVLTEIKDDWFNS